MRRKPDQIKQCTIRNQIKTDQNRKPNYRALWPPTTRTKPRLNPQRGPTEPARKFPHGSATTHRPHPGRPSSSHEHPSYGDDDPPPSPALAHDTPCHRAPDGKNSCRPRWHSRIKCEKKIGAGPKSTNLERKRGRSPRERRL
jgi:hypothetical protein